MHVELPIAAFVSAVAVLVPLPWHWRARQVSTLSIIAWLFLSNIIYGVNAIIWSDNVRVIVPVWCDIVTKFQMGSNIALPAACLCLCIQLERIASVRQVSVDAPSKRRWFIFDMSMCWVLPIVYMALHYIVQGHRFDVVEDFGCRPTTYVSVAAIFLVFIPPMFLSAATFFVAALALRHFFRRRADFSKHLQNSGSNLSSTHYFRLILMSIVEMVWSLTISTVNVAFTARGGLRPWHSWSFVHSGWLQVGQFPLALVPAYIRHLTFALWWAIPVSTIIFVAFFASGQEAMKGYCAVYSWFRRVTLRRPLVARFQPSPFSSKAFSSLTFSASASLPYATDFKSGTHAIPKFPKPISLRISASDSDVTTSISPPDYSPLIASTPMSSTPSSSHQINTVVPSGSPHAV